MKSNRWQVYKSKSTRVGSPKPIAKPSTAGKEALETEKVGQDRGNEKNMPIIRGKGKMKSYPQAEVPLSHATKPRKAKVVRNLPVSLRRPTGGKQKIIEGNEK